MTVTAGDVVLAAMKKSGVQGLGQNPDGSDTADALADLIDMLTQWNQQKWLTFNEVDVSFVSTGADHYTVGPGGNYSVTPRPTRIQAAYNLQINTTGLKVSTPLRVIPSREEYSRIALKKLIGFPQYVFLDTAYPLANLYPYPLPQASIYEIHLILSGVYPETLTMQTSLAAVPGIALPAMKFNLARRLRQAYGKGLRPDTELIKQAQDALEIMRDAQVQVPELVMPSSLIGFGPDRYNILSDQNA